MSNYNQHTKLYYLQFCGLYFLLCFSFATQADNAPILAAPVADITSYPPIYKDIEALAQYSGNSSAAGNRLLEQGVEVLTQVHGVLSDPNAPYQQRMQLITILGEISDDSSAGLIIEVAEQYKNNRFIYQNTLSALSKMTPTDEIKQFVNQQLESSDRHPLIQRSALNYYVKQPSQDANKWVDIYSAADASDDVRYAALYLGGVLGREDVKPKIEQYLQTGQNQTREYYSLLGYAYVSTLEEFETFVKNADFGQGNIRKVREILEFRLANAKEKKALAPGLLNSKNTQLKQAVVKHLIEEKDADVLAANWQRGDGAVRAAIKRAGFTVNVDEHGAELVKTPNNNVFPLWLYLLVFAAIAAFAFLILRKQMNNT